MSLQWKSHEPGQVRNQAAISGIFHVQGRFIECRFFLHIKENHYRLFTNFMVKCPLDIN